jgi:L-seryl-tRNA(Ser) seleniumtransferase
MIAAQPAALEQRAQAWRQQLGLGQIVDGESTVGGGSLPGEMLPTRLLQLPADRPDELAAGLRLATPAVIARIQDDRVLLDPRSVLPEQDPALLAALRTTLGRLGQGDPR